MFQKSFLFRFRIPCLHRETLWSQEGGTLDDACLLPSFRSLDDESIQPSKQEPVKFFAAWNPQGLAFSLRVSGKTRKPRFFPNNIEESDHFQICLDTRNVKDVHRATRFCHLLAFCPAAGQENQHHAAVQWLPIHRAKEHPNPIDIPSIKTRTELFKNGYQLDIFLPGKVLTGFHPQEYPQLGFHYALTDQEIGDHFFLVKPPLPHGQDPSVWGTLDLV